MDTPDRPRAGAGAAAADGFEDSPVFNFINNLSPIPPPKPSESAHNVQLFKSSDLAPVSSIFTSPHVNPGKEPKLLIRDDSVQLPQESNSPNSVRTRIGTTSSMLMIECKKIISENCSVTCYLNEPSIDSSNNTSNSMSDLPQSIQLGCGSAESDENQNADGQTDLTMGQECTEREYALLDHSGPNKMGPSHSGRHAHENQLHEQHKDELVAYNGDYLITHQTCSDMLTLAPPLQAETQLASETSKTDEAYACKASLTGGSSGSYIDNSTHDPHLYWSGAAEGPAADYTPKMPPGACQTQLVSNDQTCNKLDDPGDYMPVDQNALSQHLRGMRRRCLFNEKAGAVKNASDHQSANSSTPKCKNISGDNNSKPPRTPPCALPGIGLHLNALATIPQEKPVPHDVQTSMNQAGNLPCAIGSCPPIYEPNIINDDSSQVTMVAKAGDEPGESSPKKKRFKFDNGDGTSCKRCSCKKSKCLKLYCECFHAGVFCSEPCSCQGCLNKPSNMETVLSTREQIESRNPLAFAPKVIRTSELAQESGDDPNKTPASARHKRGCNCKKSSCLKKYCECYQGGVGCSISCRCEGCKNAFGKREGVVVLSIEEAKREYQEKNACVKEEKSESDKQLVICQATDLALDENVLTPSTVDFRPLTVLPPPCSKKPRSSTKLIGCSSRSYKSQAPLKSDTVLSPFENYAEIILGEGASDTLKGNSPSENSVKVVSPNKKRISPPRIGTGLSPICKSGRKLILKSIPSFPSLGGDANNEDPKTSSPAP